MSIEVQIREKIRAYAPIYSDFLHAALGRDVWMNGATLSIGGADIICDFRHAANLHRVDEIFIPFINDFLIDVRKLEMTAFSQMFDRPQYRYALEHGVSEYSFLEITELLKAQDVVPALRLLRPV